MSGRRKSLKVVLCHKTKEQGIDVSSESLYSEASFSEEGCGLKRLYLVIPFLVSDICKYSSEAVTLLTNKKSIICPEGNLTFT